MNGRLDILSNIPVSTKTIASLFPEIRSGGEKVLALERQSKLIRLKRGLYVLNPAVSGVPLCTELIANHLYAPSYVSMSTALRYYGLIPEAVFTIQSMTVKHSRDFETSVGRFQYTKMGRESFHIGVVSIRSDNYTFLIATPEKALCDLIANSPAVNLRYLKDVEHFISEDIRMDLDDFRKMDSGIFRQYTEFGKKSSSIKTIIKYLSR